MAAGDLTTLENAQDWLGLASLSDPQTSRLERLISSVSSQIQKFLGYQVMSASYTRTLDGTGGHRLMLPDRPVTAVCAIQIGASLVVPAGSPGVAGYSFTDDGIELSGYRFCGGFQNVTVSYTAGYTTVPFDIEQACLEWMSGVWQGQDRDPALLKLKAGGSEETYAQALIAKTPSMVPPTILAYLQPYRRVF